jgi:RND family efflux transporter MFP subunit
MLKYLLILIFLTASIATNAAPQNNSDKAKKSPAPAKAKMKMAPPVVAVEKSSLVNIATFRRYIGLIKAEYDINLVARINGLITKQHVSSGSIIKKGQLIFELEDTTYKAKVASAEARVKQYEAELRYAETQFNRNKTLRGQNAVSESAYDEAMKAFATTSAKLAEAKAELIDARNNLSYTKIYSPITGKMGKATYTPHNYVTPSSQPLVNVVSLDPIHVDFSISYKEYLSMFGSFEKLKKNADIKLTLADNSLYPLTGNVLYVENKVDTDTDSVTIRSIFKNPNNKLIPGGLITVSLGKKTGNQATAVRLSAVMSDGKTSYVYTLDKNNIPQRKNVKLGSVANGFQLIESGLDANETIVVDGTHKVFPGMAVKPVPYEGGK